jgi:hypothetical protein
VEQRRKTNKNRFITAFLSAGKISANISLFLGRPVILYKYSTAINPACLEISIISTLPIPLSPTLWCISYPNFCLRSKIFYSGSGLSGKNIQVGANMHFIIHSPTVINFGQIKEL